MRMTTRAAVLGALMIGASGAGAQVQQQGYGPFPYNHAYVNYAMTELSSGGYEIGGSVDVANRIHAFASYQDWELSRNVDRRTIQLGAGYRWALSPNVDAIGHLAWADNRIRRPGPNLDDEGLIAGGTLRGWASRNLELSGSVLLDSSIGSGVDPVLEFGGQYYFNGSFSLGGRIRMDEDDSTVFLGGRYHFGPLRGGNR